MTSPLSNGLREQPFFLCLKKEIFGGEERDRHQEKNISGGKAKRN